MEMRVPAACSRIASPPVLRRIFRFTFEFPPQNTSRTLWQILDEENSKAAKRHGFLSCQCKQSEQLGKWAGPIDRCLRKGPAVTTGHKSNHQFWNFRRKFLRDCSGSSHLHWEKGVETNSRVRVCPPLSHRSNQQPTACYSHTLLDTLSLILSSSSSNITTTFLFLPRVQLIIT